MTRKILLSATLVSSLAFAEGYYGDGPALITQQYDTGVYVGLAYGYTSVKDDYYEYFPTEGLAMHTDIDYNAMMFQAGFQYNPFIAFEFRYWLSMDNGSYSIDSNIPPLYPPDPGSYNDFDAWGFYVKPMYPVTTEFSIYGLLGFSGVYVAGEPGWDLLDDGDFSWGLGASYYFTPNISIFADYVWLFDSTIDRFDYGSDATQDTSVTTINVGLAYRF